MTQEMIHKPKALAKQAKTEKAVFQYMYFNTGSSLKYAARDLKLNYFAVAKAWQRLKDHYDLSTLCPVCFHETLYNGVCHTCGFEDSEHTFEYGLDRSLKTHEPVFMIQPHNGLGTQVDYNLLKFKYGSLNIAHLVEHEDDWIYENIKKKLLNELKKEYPDDRITNLAARILRREYERFKLFYPDLISKRDFNRILIEGVLKAVKRWWS